MHIAWSRPVCISEADVPQALMHREREIFKAQAVETGKPPQIVEKIVAGKIEKFLDEVTLLGQPFVKAADKTPVAKLLADAKARVTGFERFEVGEGIPKKADTFAAEVMAEARGE
jgi:elongation factor Ts